MGNPEIARTVWAGRKSKENDRRLDLWGQYVGYCSWDLCFYISFPFEFISPSSVYLASTKWVTMLALLWPVAYVDFVTCRIPNRFIAGGLLARGSILTAELILEQENLLPVLLSDAAAGLAFFLTAALCALIVKNSIGAGDMKLFFVMGTFLGLQGTWGAVFLSLVVSFVIAVVLLVTKKKSRKDAIPFGPALMIGTYCSVFLTGM